jgi:PilZ domain
MGDSPGSPSESGPPYREQRSVPRYTFIASAEISEPTSELRIAGRISEISRKGCYVDLLNTLPVSTPINLRITRDSGTFSTPAKIIYVQEAMGMGVAFEDPPEEQLRILDSWLAEIAAA